MRMKSYFANTVEAAIGQARAEFGPDAALVTSRAAGPEARHLGQYEVVFAADLPALAPAADASAVVVPPPPAAQQDLGRLLGELRELRERIDSLRRSPARGGEPPRWIGGEPVMERAWADLMEAEVEPELAERFLVGAVKRTRPAAVPASSGFRWDAGRTEGVTDEALLHAALVEEIQNSFSVDSSLGEPSAHSRLVALVGPPGAGKTAMIAKLAVHYGLSARRPAALFSLDTLRVAASEQLRWYASILGIAFQALGSAHELAQALEEHRNKDLILIDTAGFTIRDLENGAADSTWLARRSDIQKHLVLPATLRAADLARISEVYRAAFEPARLIFTRMDEAGVHGPALCEAARTGLPVSFFGTGQKVPEDLEPARKQALLDRVLPARQRRGAALSAA
jgi:flagellar biosynthesis protein FlhF